MNFCRYYQAHINRSETWFLVATLRSYEHCAFDRTLNKEQSIFEFFVPESNVTFFEKYLEYLKQKEIVISYRSLPNRLAYSAL